jgi:hypothetical protein
MVGSWRSTAVKLLGSTLMLGVVLAWPALAQTSFA